MIEGAEPSSPPSRWFSGIGFGDLFGGLTAVVTIAAIGRAWAACDIDSSAAANGTTLLFLAQLIWLEMPHSYPAPFCPGNVPPWWPSFIPA
ncbi:hypothetical protein ABZY10_37855 [Streptomyces sp. NPDC006539]|uniref:hypothetical protein n=1 Tax=Streptomyces sp. NPDC006539 TaxID=3155352 RepID=UPI0033A4EAA3